MLCVSEERSIRIQVNEAELRRPYIDNFSRDRCPGALAAIKLAVKPYALNFLLSTFSTTWSFTTRVVPHDIVTTCRTLETEASVHKHQCRMSLVQYRSRSLPEYTE